MSRKYTHVQELAEEVFRRKAAGETHRAIGEAFGLTKKQVRELVHRENRKARRAAAGYIPQPKGRPRISVHIPSIPSSTFDVQSGMPV